MQLKLNVTETTNEKFRDYCEQNELSLSQGISNLLLKVEMLEKLSKQQQENNQDLRSLVNMLKSQQK